MTSKFKKLASQIQKSYLSNIDQLDPIHQRHFLYRLYLSNKDKRNKQFLIQIAEQTNYYGLNLVDEFNQNFRYGLEKIKQEIRRKKAHYPHENKRYQVWSQNPELVYFYTVLRECFYLKFFNQSFSLNQQQVEQLHHKLINSPEFLNESSTHSLCIIFYLDYLNNLPIKIDQNKWSFVNLVKKQFLPHQLISVEAKFNYLYGLTHIIICDSHFYLKQPDEILKGYASEIQAQILNHYTSLSLDLKAEGLLCSLLLNQVDEKFKNKVINDLYLNYDNNLKIIDNHKTSRPTHQSCEHTNALAILIARAHNLTHQNTKPQLILRTD